MHMLEQGIINYHDIAVLVVCSATQLQLAGKRAPIISAHHTLQRKRTGVRSSSLRSKDCLSMQFHPGSSAVSLIAGYTTRLSYDSPICGEL